jgi:lysophospholipase L1-like esterase
MTWTSILGRKMDHPLINLAFSGNGRMEPEIIELLTELDPKVYILDCLPNLTARTGIPLDDVKARILSGVRRLRKAKPAVPIILTEHASYTDEAINPTSRRHYSEVNEALRMVFAQLKSEGISGLYLLPKDALGQDLDTMVDGTHPTDLGMFRYAEGYEALLRQVLHEPIGPYTTTRPCTQLRELPGYDWELRHRQVLAHHQATRPATVLIGNSITHYWGGLPKAHIARGQASFEATFGRTGVSNMGFGWDRIENVLWRVYHGELDGFEAKRILVMIGTNNLHLNTDEEILAGWKLLIEAIQQRQPKAQLHMVGIYPRRNQEKRIRLLNEQLARLTGLLNVGYLDPGAALLQTNGTIQENLFTDGLHPNTAGYEALGKAFSPYLN